ncbi:hypothetical protein DSM14862_02032 [Sulfitobacter indolifex]|jgi:hypothetical protein|uniref:Tetratricopeptide repeat-like domain-containing protein n=1 Tax=Sulfitobacter indolifex HEL-45 TaxID=391624 RepID=A0ABP2D807_9RHOB|nr:hypothetical protein [Sulfitobacter indolifex]EDQ04395.1 hypothetical protein OIHEL45_15739 [Sulfitobacter indolifex HEL-45]UOA19241.1 hypothetical protein DSM14862_02032 [Sulfitobacter indolifex]
MSDTDSFIDEVNEEVRRDRLYGLMRRYGWIAVVAVIAIVGGAAWNEYSKAQERAQAEALGDAMLAALEADASNARAEALAPIEAEGPGANAVLNFMRADALAEAGEIDAAVEQLDAIALDGDLAPIYRQLAQFKAVTLQGQSVPVAERRQALEALAQPGAALRLLAEEQLALIDIQEGETGKAVARYQSILSDAETTPDLQQRALQVIVALGKEPELDGAAAEAELDIPETTGD